MGAPFPTTTVFHLGASTSDHVPNTIVLEDKRWRKRREKRFRFEKMWLRHTKCEGVVASAWASEDAGLLEDRIKRGGADLLRWNASTFGHVQKQIRDKKKELKFFQTSLTMEHGVERCRQLLGEINELLEREEIMWRQRSRIEWLRNGDRNTGFFHGKAS